MENKKIFSFFNILLSSVVSLFFTINVFSQYPISSKDSIAIMSVMSQQEKAWNQGDINSFMEGYLKSEELVFSGSDGPVYGWSATKERYFKSYPDLKTMGKLTFTINKIKSLSSNSAYLIGEYYLKRTIEDSFGYFTLVWIKTNGKWLIVSDHTSSSK
jgi:hypothetical protein